MTDIPAGFIPDSHTVVSDVPDDRDGDIPDCLNPQPAVRPDYFQASGFHEVDARDAVDCPDCGELMTFARELPTEPFSADVEVTAYRCVGCMAIDFVAAAADIDAVSDLDFAELLKATLEGQR